MEQQLSEIDLEIRRLMRRAIRAENMRTTSCVGKVAFRTFVEAFRIARKKYESVKNRRVPYKCPICYSYHLGTPRDAQF